MFDWLLKGGRELFGLSSDPAPQFVKKPKSAVDYQSWEPMRDACGHCKNFLPRQHECLLVAGSIHAMDWCKLFDELKLDRDC